MNKLIPLNNSIPKALPIEILYIIESYLVHTDNSFKQILQKQLCMRWIKKLIIETSLYSFKYKDVHVFLKKCLHQDIDLQTSICTICHNYYDIRVYHSMYSERIKCYCDKPPPITNYHVLTMNL
jgi:hypothetical protein